MSNYLVLIFKIFRRASNTIPLPFYSPINKLNLFLNGASFGKKINTKGFLRVIVTRRGCLKIGNNVSINSGQNHNIIGRNQKTTFWVEGNLSIGHNTGMSSTSIICNHHIEIGNYVKIGGNTVIYDTDFHSLNPETRKDPIKDRNNSKKGKVIIKDNAFIGSHSTILKGVTIGENAIIGACSLVSKNIPENEIWAGNPIKFIKTIDEV
ncbi:acyltransferase [Algibacter lectus]|uniref:acyltransferase n=1 Tax=Algibacter lectus TaxID=221126 RepID=UPI0024958FCD|nr:acyltransferase [Algibacter lectus]